jgi:hypothetical protein
VFDRIAERVTLHDIRERFDMSYGDEADEDEWFDFEPKLGDIVVMADGNVYLVGHLNMRGGACSCCREFKGHPRHYRGYIPLEDYLNDETTPVKPEPDAVVS